MTALYESGEPLELELDIHRNKPVREVQLRLTFRTDTDAGLGTAWSEIMNLGDIAEDDFTVRFKMNMDIIAKGTFYVSIGLYKRDEIGRAMSVDHITRAFKIEVKGSPAWYTSAYGNIALPEIETEIQISSREA